MTLISIWCFQIDFWVKMHISSRYDIVQVLTFCWTKFLQSAEIKTHTSKQSYWLFLSRRLSNQQKVISILEKSALLPLVNHHMSPKIERWIFLATIVVTVGLTFALTNQKGVKIIYHWYCKLPPHRIPSNPNRAAGW
jgi:hypothetical protein